jgi:UDP:flavonoid glycosyltransferase YjiC (YdhE family)
MMPGIFENKPLLLVFPFGLLSHYLRCLVLCRHLRDYFEIKIANNPAFRSFITQEALATFECEEINADAAIKSMKKFDFSWLNEAELERAFLEQSRIIRSLKPVAVMGDHSITLKMAAESTGSCYVSLLNGYISKHYAAHRDISRTHPAYPFLKMLPDPLQAVLTKHGERIAFRQIHKAFGKIRKKYKLSSKYQYLDELEGNLTIICDLPELFPQGEQAPGYLQISPLVYTNAATTKIRPSYLNPDKKTIFASIGSTGDWQNISFLNNRFFEKYNVVAAGDENRILPAPHICHRPFVNIDELFPFTDLVVCHGGNGTLYQALLHQIPLLCRSSHCEHEWNIYALEKNNLCKSLDDVSDQKLYMDITEEWVNKKGNEIFKTFSEKVRQGTSRLPRETKQIADRILQTGQVSTMSPQTMTT